jgi:formylglycine-generating enzyme required for sulfatase activity
MCGKKGNGGSSSSSVITAPATQVTATSAVLNGTVNPNGIPTNAYFQWGTTTSYGNSTTAQAIGNGSVSLPVSATVSGLTPITLYNFRIVSTDAEGTTYGGNLTFTTLVAPPAQVGSPTPGNGAINVPINQQLSWGAVSGATYNVYFGTSATPPFVTNLSTTYYLPPTLNNNILYYWRIDSTNAISGTTTGNVWSFTTIDVPPVQPVLAGPGAGATNIPTNQQLSWAVASGATSYDVYFGTTSTNLTFITNTVLTSFTPSVLSFNTQYYWRIDSVNAAGTTTGNIWSFTTEPPPPPPPQASSPIPTNTATAVLINQQLSWGAASGAASYNVYFGTTSTSLTFITNTVLTFFSPFVLSLSTIYYWRIDSVNAGGTTTGVIWSFTTTSIAPPAQVTTPTPANGATDVPINQQLSWGAVPGATYNVYFGTTTTGWAPITNTTLLTYQPITLLSYSTIYYWRIDSTNPVSNTTTGVVWSFTTTSMIPTNNDACYISNAGGNSVTATGVSLGTASGGQVPITFNLSQQNPFGDVAFDGIAFSDYLWVFIKYSTTNGTDGSWNHCTLAAGGTVTPTADNLGVFIRSSLAGPGGNNFTVRWNYTANGIGAIDANNTVVRVFAIEMVEIPTGAFYYNVDGLGGVGFNNYYSGVTPSLIANTTQVPNGAADGWPNGYNAFYLAKYEVTQGQYVDFLNNILSATAAAYYSASWDVTGYRIGNTGVYPNQYWTDVPNRACNFVSWDNMKAYLSWTALRPITEMEFEKAARGTQQGGTNTRLYPWGNTAPATTTGTIEGGTHYIYYANLYADFTGGWKPILVGWYLSQGYAPANREWTGASPYGIADLSGNLWEHVINCAWTTVPLNGNGTITPPASWPTAYPGKTIRGGSWKYPPGNDIFISGRNGGGGYTYAYGTDRQGIRPARTK